MVSYEHSQFLTIFINIFMINFNICPEIFCPKHGTHFCHTYLHFLACPCLETTRQFNIIKAKHSYKSAESAIWYYLYTSPYISRLNWIDVYCWFFQNCGFSITEWFHGYIGQLAWTFYSKWMLSLLIFFKYPFSYFMKS